LSDFYFPLDAQPFDPMCEPIDVVPPLDGCGELERAAIHFSFDNPGYWEQPAVVSDGHEGFAGALAVSVGEATETVESTCGSQASGAYRFVAILVVVD
jgi:hypothetical protein